MGIVYRGFDPILERDVALKTMMASFTTMDDEGRNRFYREARAAGKLRHPNIVTIYDMGEDQGIPYIAMELLEGIDLHRKMKTEGPLPPRHAVEIVAHVAEGLAYAHGFGIVHRDVKPANIFITRDGAVKILDFGIAKLAASEMTRSGMVLGTVDYMSPEQIRADRAMDGRSDLFSVGVILYELLSAQKPFPGETLTQVMYKIVYEEPLDINTLRQLPAALSAMVSRALQKDPAARFQTGQELAAMLWEIASGLGSPSESGRLGAGSFTSVRLAAAQRLLDAARPEEAAAIVREVLDSEPANTGALALSEVVEARLKSQATATLTPADLPPATSPPGGGTRPPAPVTSASAATQPAPPPSRAAPPPPSVSRLPAPPPPARGGIGPAATESTVSLEETSATEVDDMAESLPRQAPPPEPGTRRTGRRPAPTGVVSRQGTGKRPAAGTAAPTGRSRTMMVAGGAVLVLLVIAGGIYLATRGSSGPAAGSTARQETARTETPPLPPPAAPAAAGFLAVDAAPWAEVCEVVDLDTGETLQVAADTTPCVLEVPPGRYRLTLLHPDFGQRTAQADVSSDSVTRVFETMPGFTAPFIPQRSDR